MMTASPLNTGAAMPSFISQDYERLRILEERVLRGGVLRQSESAEMLRLRDRYAGYCKEMGRRQTDGDLEVNTGT